MAKYTILKKRLFEAQLGRCAACACHLSIQNSASRDPRRLSLVCINNKMAVSYDNAILMCGKCAGWAGNCPSLEEFYENYIVQRKGKKEKVQNVYPETVPLINAFLIKMYKEADAISELSSLIDAKSKYIHAPPENAEKIAKSLFSQYLRAQPKTYTYKAKVNRKKHNANGLLEAQNHRCCYCHSRFSTKTKSTRYATFEHVIPRRRGGTNHKWNLVMACAICNHTRDILNMTAEEFYYWVQENPNEIIKAEQAFIAKTKNKSLKNTIQREAQ